MTVYLGCALHKVKQAHKHAILADAWRIDGTHVEAEMRARAAAFRTTWEVREPKAVANFFTDFAQTLRDLGLDFPRAFVAWIRATNLLEPFQEEVPRKQHDIPMFQRHRGCKTLWSLPLSSEPAGSLRGE